MLPDWFKLALDARIHREHLYLLLDADKLGTREFDKRRFESTGLAREAGYAAPTIPMPALLSGDDELEEFFRAGQEQWRSEQSGPTAGDLVYLGPEEGLLPGIYELR